MSQLTWVMRDGKDAGTLAPPGRFYSPRLSHDGRRVAVDLSDPVTNKGDIWIFDLRRNTGTRLTYDPANESVPVWTKDDQRIVFLSEKRGTADLYEHAAIGPGTDIPLLANSVRKQPLDISPDDRSLMFSSLTREQFDLWLLSRADKRATPWLATPFNEVGGQFSPDGKYVAYSSDESGQMEVYVRPFSGSGEKYLMSRNGGRMPCWRNDGHELYYVATDRRLMAVTVRLEPTFDAGDPHILFEARLRTEATVTARQYDTRDGQNFLLNRAVGEEGSRPMTLVQNWAQGIDQ